MEATVVQTEKVQSQPPNKGTTPVVFRWQKWMDGDGRLWIVTCTFGHDNRGRYGANVELLNVDQELTIDVTRAEFEDWIRTGTLKRVNTPLLL